MSAVEQLAKLLEESGAIPMIPLELSRYIARTYKPVEAVT